MENFIKMSKIDFLEKNYLSHIFLKMPAVENVLETFYKFLRETKGNLPYSHIPIIMIYNLMSYILENVIKIFLNCENNISFHAHNGSEIRVCKNYSESMPYKYKFTVLPMDAPNPGDYSVLGESNEIYKVNIPHLHPTDIPYTNFLPTELCIYSDTSDIGDIKYGLSQHIAKIMNVDTSVDDESITIYSFVNIDYCENCRNEGCICDFIHPDNPCLVKINIYFDS